MPHWIQLLGDALKLMLETQINSLSAALEWGWEGPDPVRGTRWSGKVEHRLVLPVCLPRPPQRQPHRGPGRATPLEMKKPQHALRRGPVSFVLASPPARGLLRWWKSLEVSQGGPSRES